MFPFSTLRLLFKQGAYRNTLVIKHTPFKLSPRGFVFLNEKETELRVLFSIAHRSSYPPSHSNFTNSLAPTPFHVPVPAPYLCYAKHVYDFDMKRR